MNAWLDSHSAVHSAAPTERGSFKKDAENFMNNMMSPSKPTASSRFPSVKPSERDDSDSDDDEIFTPRRLAEQVDAFTTMRETGAAWHTALFAALQGHKMTEEQAACFTDLFA